MKPPEFLKVLTADVGRVGALGAAILALVRYVTGLSDERNGRKTVDGEMWWSASHDDIGQALGGVHRDSVRRALVKLQGSGELLTIPAERFYGDRAQAYRAPDHPLRGTQQGTDHPLRGNAESITRNAASSCGENAQAAAAKARNVPIPLENWGEHSVGENGAHNEGDEPLDVETVPDPAGPDNLPAPQNGHMPPSANDKPKSDRGTRLPDDWMPDRAVIEQMRAKCPNVNLRAEHAKFVDYWAGVPGAKGRKLDWSATWRNWIRRADEYAAPIRNGSAVEDNVNGWLARAQQIESDDEGGLW